MSRDTIVFGSVAVAGVGCAAVGAWFLHLNNPNWFYWLLAGVLLLALIYDDRE